MKSLVKFFLLFALLLPITAQAGGDCDLSLAPAQTGACPANAIGTNSPHPEFRGATLPPKTSAQTAIDAFGFCRYAANDGNAPLFIPFNDAEEWRAFQNNNPPGTRLTPCVRGGNISIPANFGDAPAGNQCAAAPALQSSTLPYRPASITTPITTPPITYVCKSSDGTSFTETATATLDSRASSATEPGNDIGWSFDKILYVYDGICGPAKDTPSATTPTSGLCSVGTPSKVIGLGPYQWICAGGNGGGKNVTCSTGVACQSHVVEQKPCRCEGSDCYRARLWADTCGHSGIDKSQKCTAPEPTFKPLPPIDYDNQN